MEKLLERLSRLYPAQDRRSILVPVVAGFLAIASFRPLISFIEFIGVTNPQGKRLFLMIFLGIVFSIYTLATGMCFEYFTKLRNKSE